MPWLDGQMGWQMTLSMNRCMHAHTRVPEGRWVKCTPCVFLGSERVLILRIGLRWPGSSYDPLHTRKPNKHTAGGRSL